MAETIVGQATKRVAVVTGANKGIGLEISRQLGSNGMIVVLTARDEKRGVEAIENLKSSGLCDIIFHQLDVNDTASVASLVNFITTQFGKLDILVNNAGVFGVTIDEFQKALKNENDHIVGEKVEPMKEIVKPNLEMVEACLGTNYYGVKLVTKHFVPLLQLSDSPRIINVSSTMGQLKLIPNERGKELADVDTLTEEKVDEIVKGYLEDAKLGSLQNKGWPTNFSAYIVSKAALNAYTRVLAKLYPKIAINAICPGYVKTDLNFNSGVLTVEEGAKGPVMLALMPHAPSGLFFSQMEVSSF